MSLPDLVAQAIYAKLAWGIVAAAVVMRLFDALPLPPQVRRPQVRRALGVVVSGSMWLTHELSPAYWLGMVLHAPSVMLTLLCLTWILRREMYSASDQKPAFVTIIPAATIALSGLLLYASVFAWIPYDFYALGFHPTAGTLVAAAVALLWRLLGRESRVAALCLAISLSIHAVLRLPTGNLWDAVLDPLLVAAMCAVTIRWLVRSRRATISRQGSPSV